MHTKKIKKKLLNYKKLNYKKLYWAVRECKTACLNNSDLKLWPKVVFPCIFGVLTFAGLRSNNNSARNDCRPCMYVCMSATGGYVVLGSNGEFQYLTADERVEIVRRVRQMTAPHQLIIAGAGCECKNISPFHKSTRCKAKPVGSPPAYPPRRLLIYC